MAYTSIDKPSDYFETVLYTGNGGTQSITGVGFTQDFTWIKSRSTTQNHYAFDTVRGAQKQIYPSTTSAEDTGQSNGLNAFTSDGFNLGTEVGVNGNGATFASWNWKAGGSASSNSNGSITSSVSANTDAGFSIVSYTGTGNSNNTVGHGLTQPLDLLIVKNRDASAGWKVGSTALSGNGYDYSLALQGTSAENANSSPFNNTAPTSSVFKIASFSYADTNVSGQDFVAYCFHSVKGFSKIGSYTGNGSTNGTFIYTGFKPAFVLIKKLSGSAQWQILDNKRDTYNPAITALFPDSNDPDTTSYNTDFLSNGFKQRATTGSRNGSGATYLYMAFAENPLVTSTGIPACAR